MHRTAVVVRILGGLLPVSTPVAVMAQGALTTVQRTAIVDSVGRVADSVFAAGRRRDLSRMFSFYSPSTTLLHDGTIEDWATHQAGARAFYKTLRAADVHPLSYEIEPLSPTTALWRGQYAFSFTDSSGRVTAGKAANTWVFSRRPSGWQIVHVHISDPLPVAK